MRGLLVRLSTLDSDAERAVRVIAFFDALTQNNANVEMLVRAAAGLSECVVGVADATGSVLARFDEDGQPLELSLPTSRGSERRFTTIRGEALVWIERASQHELDEIVLDRLVIAAEIILDRRSPTIPLGANDEYSIRALINSHSSESDKLQAAGAINLVGPIAAIAARSQNMPPELFRMLAQEVQRDTGYAARACLVESDLVCLLVATPDGANVFGAGAAADPAMQIGVGPVGPTGSTALSWAAALRALKFAQARGVQVVRADELGTLSLLATLLPGQLKTIRDVQAIERVHAARNGDDILATVMLVCSTGSLRQASIELHRHHSSVAQRMNKAQEILGYALDSPDALFRTRLAIEAWRLSSLSQPTQDRAHGG